MIIGISGKINSGKDLTAEIIQYLVDMNSVPNTDMSFDSWLRCHDTARKERCSGWKIRKFADKLKDIICLLIGCTREQLEDRVFKEKLLGEGWWLYEVQEKPSQMFKIIQYSEDIDLSVYYDAELVKLTPRRLLQLIGTEAGRNIIHPNIWINALFADYRNKYEIFRGQNHMLVEQGIMTEEQCMPNWIITDTRFENEAKAIKDRGGIVIRVNRPDSWVKSQEKEILAEQWNYKEKEHTSETGLDDYLDFDYIINNDGTIEELIEKVREILIKEKIIS